METQGIKTSLRDYFRILYYWKTTAIVLFLIVPLTALAVSFVLPPVYEAFTLILVEREPGYPLLHKTYEAASVPPQLAVAEERAELAKTQSEIIKSRHILERVILDFGLDKKFEGPNEIEKAVTSLQDRIKIRLKEETSIIQLSVEDNDPELAANVTNAIALEYVKWVSEVRQTKSKGASGVLAERIGVLDKELKEAESRLEQLKKEGDVAAIKEELTTTVTKLADFNAEYEHVVAEIEEEKTKLKELKGSLERKEDLITVSQRIVNPLVDALKMKLLDLELKRTELLSKYNKGSELLESVEEEIAQTKEKLSDEITSVINSAETDLSALQARKEVLEEVKGRYSKRLKQLSGVELEYRRLERQLKGKSELYITLLGKHAEASLTEAVTGGLLVDVRVIDPANVPFKPVRPNKLLNTVLGCLVGLMGGIGGAFLKEYWDHSLKTIDEIRRYLELPTLATVAKAKGKAFTLYTPGSPISESFHTLSTGVQQLCKENGINTLLVTSANRGEGKSVISANLAVSLASIEGKRILVVDANLRQPVMHRFFEVKTKSNLVDVLSQKKIIRPDPTDIRNLSLISTTDEIPEPSRLLASDPIREFIRKIKVEYDYVIIDSPALISYPDASILGFEAEGIIFVIQFGKTKREAIERAKSLLDKSQRKILGAVLNNVEYVIPERLYRRL